MEMPQEIEVWYILPTIRRELAVALKNEGLKQNEIAERLGITNAAVSQYIQNKRAGTIKFSKDIMNAIKKSANNIAKGSSVMQEIFNIEKVIKKSKMICKMCINAKRKCEICQ